MGFEAQTFPLSGAMTLNLIYGIFGNRVEPSRYPKMKFLNKVIAPIAKRGAMG